MNRQATRRTCEHDGHTAYGRLRNLAAGLWGRYFAFVRERMAEPPACGDGEDWFAMWYPRRADQSA